MLRSSLLLTFVLVGFAGKADASVHAFSCTTAKKLYDRKIHTLKFRIENLEAGKISLVDDESTETGLSFSVTPTSSKLQGLTENWAVSRREGNLRWVGDSDGFFDVELLLYADSEFRSGYVKIRDNGEGIGDSYSTLNCRVKEIEK